MQDIVYKVGDSLYLNITNRCTNQCQFCIRYKSRYFNKKYALWLDQEPSAKEVIKAMGDPTKYKQIVFCGYGESLIRLDTIKQVAQQIKSKTKKTKIRVDTNGHANLFWGRNILPELEGLIDIMSISLDAENTEIYDRICLSIYGKRAYPAVINFIEESKKYVPEVEATVVDLPMIEIAACKKIATKLKVRFRVRPYYEETYVR